MKFYITIHTAVEFIGAVSAVWCPVTLATAVNAAAVTTCKLVVLAARVICQHCTQPSLSSCHLSLTRVGKIMI